MSAYAATPETHAAWRYLEVDDELRPYDQERTEMTRERKELGLLLAGTKHSFSPRLHSYL